MQLPLPQKPLWYLSCLYWSCAALSHNEGQPKMSDHIYIYIYDRSRCALAFPVPFRRMVWLSSTHWRTDHAISVYALQERAPQGGSTCSTLGLAAAGSTVLAVAPRLHALRSLSVQIVCRLFGLWRRCLHFSCERGRQKKQVQQTRQEAWPRQ